MRWAGHVVRMGEDAGLLGLGNGTTFSDVCVLVSTPDFD
jgi:hypothetical protein